MADNSIETHKESLAAVEAVTSSDVITPSPDTEPDTPNQEIETMEVHHHRHHEGERDLNSYFWEFLMLFLAVFCGVLAEYGLEHKIESDREEEFIETMISDLQEDTLLLGQSIVRFEKKGVELDSLITLLNSTNVKAHGPELYYYGRLASRFDFFTSTDRTIQQMKNAGAFRLIRDDYAASSILKYYSEMNSVYQLQTNTNDLAMEYRSMVYTIFDPVVFETMVNDETKNWINKPVGNPSLLSYDKSDKARVSSMLHYMKASRLVLYDRYVYLHARATVLIRLLKKEYHLN